MQFFREKKSIYHVEKNNVNWKQLGPNKQKKIANILKANFMAQNLVFRDIYSACYKWQ